MQLAAIGDPAGSSMQQVKSLMLERILQLKEQAQNELAAQKAEKERSPFDKLQRNKWALQKCDKRHARASERLDEANAALRAAEEGAAEATAALQAAHEQGERRYAPKRWFCARSSRHKRPRGTRPGCWSASACWGSFVWICSAERLSRTAASW